MASLMVVIAMADEAAPIVKELALIPDAAMPAPFLAYAGKAGGTSVTVVCNGPCPKYKVDAVGTEAAALATYVGIQTYRPDLVINAGTCGGFAKRGAKIGDVYLVDEFKRHDRRIPIPAFVAYADGATEATTQTAILADALRESWDAACQSDNEESPGAVKQGVLTTGNSFTNTDRCLEVMESFGAHVKDMEGQAVAWTCSLSGTKLVGIKSVTDIVDRDPKDAPGEEEFLKNLSTAARALKRAIVIMLGVLQTMDAAHV